MGTMTRKFFGTDGIRGRANGLITPELALKVGQAAGIVFQRGDHRHRVVIGKDTRLSGYMIETALVAGFTSVGMDVMLLGPVPTPAVAMLTRSLRCDLGVMISASHNLFDDNGIKMFSGRGEKFTEEAERRIETLVADTSLSGTRVARELTSLIGQWGKPLLVVSDNSHVIALDANSGQEVWRNTDLEDRWLTPPAFADGRLVVGDFEGYVHLLDAREGNLVGRTRVHSSGISVRPVTEGSTIHVQANNGRLETLEVTP